MKGRVAMTKCIKIIFKVTDEKNFLYTVVQKQAKKENLEGAAHILSPGHIKVIVCGTKERVDNFIDALHKEQHTYDLRDIEIEAFIKDRDFRGAFRIIE
jgi:acylphosphatase